MQFISNFSNALKIIDRELNGNAVLASRNIAGIQNIAYIIDNLKINSSGKLTINPGVVIKFRTSNSYILSEGNLIAKGTPEQIVKCKESYTGYYIARMLERDKKISKEG